MFFKKKASAAQTTGLSEGEHPYLESMHSRIEKLNNILKLDNAAEKTEQLLSFKETLIDNQEKLHIVKPRIFESIMLLGGGLVVASLFVPALASAFLWGLIVSAIGVGAKFLDKVSFCEMKRNQIEVIKDKTDKEVSALIDSHPHEVVHSPKFRQSIKAGFNNAAGADVEEKFAKLTASAAQEKAAALSKN
ncbi:MAG: hypothetical protein K8R48_02320 [Alphaproteobacteria bacterium]|nr:hypothetical protein [Alphaproteobacteria bacterium]